MMSYITYCEPVFRGTDYIGNAKCTVEVDKLLPVLRKERSLSDEDLLDEFIVVNWAWYSDQSGEPLKGGINALRTK